MKISFSLRKKRMFQKEQNYQKVAFKNGPICCSMLILGPVFNTTIFACLFCVCCWNHYFVVFAAKHANLKDTQKTLFVSTLVLTALVKPSIFLHFSYLEIWESTIIREVLFMGSQTTNNNKLPTQTTNKKNNKKTRCKSKRKSNLVIQNQTRQQAETKKQKNKETSWNKQQIK